MDFLRKQIQIANNEYPVIEVNTSTTAAKIKKRNYEYDKKLIHLWAKQEFGSDLITLDFQYKDKSNRLWHPLQSVKREDKKQILDEAGLKYHYDIDCCAPTLIHQYAQFQGMDSWLHDLNNYLKDKHKYRDYVSELAEIDSKTTKVVINALFCGARLGSNEHYALYKVLDKDKARVMVLQQDEFVSGLRADIKECWTAIAPLMARRSRTDPITNKERLLPISSFDRWAVYFKLERQVLEQVRKYLKLTDNNCFLEHDGWSTENPVDQEELIAFVQQHTGFSIKLSMESCAGHPAVNNPLFGADAPHTDWLTALAIANQHKQAKQHNFITSDEIITTNTQLTLVSCSRNTMQSNLTEDALLAYFDNIYRRKQLVI